MSVDVRTNYVIEYTCKDSTKAASKVEVAILMPKFGEEGCL